MVITCFGAVDKDFIEIPVDNIEIRQKVNIFFYQSTCYFRNYPPIHTT